MAHRLEQDPKIVPTRRRNRNGPLSIGEYAQSAAAREAAARAASAQATSTAVAAASTSQGLLQFDDDIEEVIPATQLQRDTSTRCDPSHDAAPRARGRGRPRGRPRGSGRGGQIRSINGLVDQLEASSTVPAAAGMLASSQRGGRRGRGRGRGQGQGALGTANLHTHEQIMRL